MWEWSCQRAYAYYAFVYQIEGVMRAIAPYHAVHFEPEWTCAMDETHTADTKHLCFVEYPKREVYMHTLCVVPLITTPCCCSACVRDP